MSNEQTAQVVVPLGEGLARQVRFALDVHGLTAIERRTYTATRRRETSAEHCWHLALLAYAFSEYAAAPVDVAHTILMLLIHDVPEIDAGDASIYDTVARNAAAALEAEAATRMFGLLAGQAGDTLHALWEEFEAQTTAEARYAKAIDRIAPLLLNHASEGQLWREAGVTAAMVRTTHEAVLEAGAPMLAETLRVLLADAVTRGWLPAE